MGEVQLDRKTFDHVGIPTDEKQDKEIWVAESRVWITSPRESPCNIEWLRYDDNSPVEGPLRQNIHIAYRIPDLERAIAGRDDVIWGPFEVADGFIRAAFVLIKGIPIELMQYADPTEEGWFS